MPTVSILVPTYNEAENIDLLLTRIFAVEELRGVDVEVVFSDGASTDETRACIREWQGTHAVRLVESDVNRGLSAAVIAGAKVARGDYVVVMDADLSHPPEKIPELLKPLLNGAHDMVIGSRYIKGGSTPDWPFSRRACSRLATLPARIFTDVKDPLAGFIAVSRERLLKLTREICGFKFGLELLLTGSQPFSVTEVPITFHDRRYGESKMSFRVILDYFHQLLILSGVSLRHQYSTTLVLLLCLLGVGTDGLLLGAIMNSGISAGWAQWLSFSLAAGVVGAATLFTAARRGMADDGKLLFERILSYWITVLLVLFLRSSVMHHLADDGFVSRAETFFLSISSVAVCYFGCVTYVFSIGRKRFKGEPVKRFYLVGLGVYLLFFRLAYSSVIPPLAEELHYLQIARAFTPGDLLNIASYPALPGAVILSFLPENMFSFRLGSFIVWFLSTVFVFALARDVYNRSVGFRALLLISVLPFFGGISLHVTRDSLLTLFWAASLFWLYRFLALGDRNAWIYAGGVLGICLVFEPLSVVLAASVCVYMLVYGGVPGWLRKRRVWTGFGTMLLVWIVFFLLAGGAGAGGEFVGDNWIDEAIGWRISATPLAPLFLMTPVGVFAGVLCCLHTGFDATPIEEVANRKRLGGNTLCTRTLFLLPMVSGVILAVLSGNFLFCSTVVWLAALPCISLSLFTEENLTGAGTVWGRRLKHLWLLMISLIIVTYGIVLHLDTIL